MARIKPRFVLGKMRSLKSLSAKELQQLEMALERWTRTEVMSRVGTIRTGEAADYFQYMLSRESEIRQLLFGTSDFVKLGMAWNMISKKRRKK